MKDFKDCRWGPILGIWSFLVLILSAVVANPLYGFLYEAEPTRLGCFLIICTPTIIALLYRLKRLIE